MTRKERLTDRTCRIIQRGGRIVIKRNDGWYLSGWTNVFSGPDGAQWAAAKHAVEIATLEWAFALAKLYKAKVVVQYCKRVDERTAEAMYSDFGV